MDKPIDVQVKEALLKALREKNAAMRAIDEDDDLIDRPKVRERKAIKAQIAYEKKIANIRENSKSPMTKAAIRADEARRKERRKDRPTTAAEWALAADMREVLLDELRPMEPQAILEEFEQLPSVGFSTEKMQRYVFPTVAQAELQERLDGMSQQDNPAQYSETYNALQRINDLVNEPAERIFQEALAPAKNASRLLNAPLTAQEANDYCGKLNLDPMHFDPLTVVESIDVESQ